MRISDEVDLADMAGVEAAFDDLVGLEEVFEVFFAEGAAEFLGGLSPADYWRASPSI